MTYQKHTRKQKLAAVVAAEMSGVIQTAEQTGIPESTIRYWMNAPEFAEFRAKTREEMESEVKVVAHLAWKRIAETMATMEPRDALFAADKATSLYLLMTGEATSRSEHRDIGDADESAVDTLEGILAGRPWEVPARVVTGRNGAKSNGSH